MFKIIEVDYFPLHTLCSAPARRPGPNPSHPSTQLPSWARIHSPNSYKYSATYTYTYIYTHIYIHIPHIPWGLSSQTTSSVVHLSTSTLSATKTHASTAATTHASTLSCVCAAGPTSYHCNTAKATAEHVPPHCPELQLQRTHITYMHRTTSGSALRRRWVSSGILRHLEAIQHKSRKGSEVRPP